MWMVRWGDRVSLNVRSAVMMNFARGVGRAVAVLAFALFFVVAPATSIADAPAAQAAAEPNVADVAAQVDAGQFAAAESAIATGLADTRLPTSLRDGLEFQRERMRRIWLDFTLS